MRKALEKAFEGAVVLASRMSVGRLPEGRALDRARNIALSVHAAGAALSYFVWQVSWLAGVFCAALLAASLGILLRAISWLRRTVSSQVVHDVLRS